MFCHATQQNSFCPQNNGGKPDTAERGKTMKLCIPSSKFGSIPCNCSFYLQNGEHDQSGMYFDVQKV